MMKDESKEDLHHELTHMLDKIKEGRIKAKDKNLKELCADLDPIQEVTLKMHRVLKGHLSKVNCVHFGSDSRNAVSGALDSKLIVWDTWTGNKIQVIPLQSSWTMTCCLSPSGHFVASGGMDNQCTIFDLKRREASSTAVIRRELLGFEGFLSCTRFIDDNKLITSSADSKIILWDVEKGFKITEFVGHEGDVMTISLGADNDVFVSGSVDKTAKMWDVREGSCRQTFIGHEADVNSVYLHRNGFIFGTASEDASCRVFDIRSDQELAKYETSGKSKFSSVALSNSARIILSASEDGSIYFWDTLKQTDAGCLSGHDSKITSISLSENGMAIISGSWDSTVRLWV